MTRKPTKIQLMTLPALICLTPFVATFVLIARYSVSAEPAAISGFSLGNYAELFDWFYLKAVLTTLRLSAIATMIVVAMAVPIAMVIGSISSPWFRRMVTTIILLPLFVNLLIQSYGWMMILGPAGLVNRALIDLGLVTMPLRLLFSESGVLIGLVQTSLPLAVFPVYVSMRRVSRDYLEAAASLGANSWVSFATVTFPLLLPGIIAGASIAFAYNASAFAVPLLLGGRRVQMLGVVIKDQIAPLLDFAAASATGVVLVAITTIVVLAGGFLARRAMKNETA